jgi:AbrB family looped-hinge helix DNA binding protein
MTASQDNPLPIAYLTTARLGEKGQITVPKEYRDALALEAGAPITMLQLGSGLILIPEHDRFRQLCDRVAQTFASHGIQAQDLLATLPEARQQVFEHHYPESSARKSARKKAKRQ